MAYDAGSVVFTFEADTTQIDKALQDVKKAASNISGGSNSSKKNQLFENLGLTDVESFRQTYNWLNQITKASRNYTNMMSNGLDPSNPADILSYLNQISTQMGNQINYSQLLNGNFSSLASGAGAAGVAVAGITAYIALAKKGLTTCVNAIKTFNNVMTTTLKYATEIVTSVGNVVYKMSGLESTVNVVKSIFSELKDTITEAFSIDNIESFIEECNDLGSSLTEIQNVVDKVFGDNADSIDTWASNATESLGMAEVTAKTYSATYASMLDIAGVSQENLETMSTTLTNLTADIASFRDTDMDTVFEKIKSGLSGQVRPLKEYGISMEAANIQEWMTAEGIDAVYTKLDYASKELIRYNYLIDKTSVLQGDWTDTFYTWANQLKYFKELINNIKSTLGQLFTGFLRPILIFVNQMLAVISTSIKSLYTDLSSLFPYLFGALEDTTKDSTDYSDILDDMEEDVESVNDAVKRTISSFDELHRLNDDSSSSSSSTSSLADNIDISTYETEGANLEEYFSDLIERIKETWRKGLTFEWFGALVGEEINKLIDYIQEKITSVKSKLIQAAKSVATFINGLLYTVDWTKLGETIRDVLQTIQDTILTFIEELDWSAVGHAFAESLKGLFSYAFDGTSASTIISKGADLIKESVNGFSDSVTTFLKDMSQEYVTFDEGFNNTKEGIETTVLDFGTTGKTLRTSVVSEWTYLGKQVANAINSLFDEENGINWEQIGQNINGLLSGILELIIVAIDNIEWDTIGESLGKCFAAILSPDEDGQTILGKIGTALGKLINGLITTLTTLLNTPGFLDNLNLSFEQFFENAFGDIQWGDVLNDYYKIKQAIEKFFKSAIKSIGVSGWATIITIATDAISTAMSNGIKILLALALVTIAASFASILDLVSDLVLLIGESLIAAFTYVGNDVKNMILAFVESWKDIIEEAKIEFSMMGEAIKEKWGEIKTAFAEGVQNVKDKISDFITALWSKWMTVKQKLSNIWTGLKSSLTSAWNWIKTNIFDAIKNGVKSMLNTVISTINSLINKLNSISFTMPDWLGGGTFGLSIPTLPLLANGGYIGADMPTAAIIGDNKNEGEIVAPESKIQENVAIALEPYMSKIESLLSTLINSSDEIHVHCEIDGDEITEIVLNNANLATARGGA